MEIVTIDRISSYNKNNKNPQNSWKSVQRYGIYTSLEKTLKPYKFLRVIFRIPTHHQF